MAKSAGGRIKVGIGGWNFVPWRDNFYPKGLPQAQELEFASRAVTTIEINSTFYRTQAATSYRRWHDATPDDFSFAVKAHRLTTHRKHLGEAGDSIAHFLDSGLLELGKKLGPINWQLAPTKKFEPEDCEAFLSALREKGGASLRHVLEVRHESFCCSDFIALARRYDMAICLALSDKYPLIADVTSDFVYARLQQAQASEPAGYPKKVLDAWAARAKLWAQGKAPDDLPTFGMKPAATKTRDCFIYFIAAAKERNPAAAQALIARLAKA